MSLVYHNNTRRLTIEHRKDHVCVPRARMSYMSHLNLETPGTGGDASWRVLCLIISAQVVQFGILRDLHVGSCHI